ncbi:hypothetical protein ACRQ5Q_22420 [Bradyrhizobium sp. PMVTL-01]|uniref:hypothetical protein n=1 Tax=Bradyrhizobium sp. PMVTL-01 TaxID=3434999 RepID=UPI003F6F2EA5
MSRTIEIRGLSDAQCDALKAEADAAGLKFFDHCRNKLLAGLTFPKAEIVSQAMRQTGRRPTTAQAAPAAPSSDEDRFARLETMMMHLADTVQQLANNPAVVVEAAPVDVEDIVGEALANVAEGEAFDEGYAATPGDGARHVGTRRPKPLHGGSVPRHVAGLFPAGG